MQNCKLFGVETDSISGRIAKQLYQNANIQITGFEKTSFPSNFFDVAVGNVPFRENSRMYWKEVSTSMEERIKAMHHIRAVTRELIEIQTEGSREDLNEAYNTFIKKYGYITDRENDSAIRNDADYPLLCSLEVVDEDGNVKKADMFYKQTIKPKIVIERVETAVEALNVFYE